MLITAVVALVLVLTILVFASTSPWLLAGLPPVLAGVAAVIRAIYNAPGGSTREDVDEEAGTEDDAPPLGDPQNQ